MRYSDHIRTSFRPVDATSCFDEKGKNTQAVLKLLLEEFLHRELRSKQVIDYAGKADEGKSFLLSQAKSSAELQSAR